MAHYPVFLDLQKRSCVVIGGCGMAEEKVKGLLAAGADVTVIAADLTPGLEEMARDGRIDWKDRGYHRGDLRRAFLAIVVGQTPRVVDTAWEEGRERKVLINTVDNVPHCHFIAPAVVQRGDLSIAISTGARRRSWRCACASSWNSRWGRSTRGSWPWRGRSARRSPGSRRTSAPAGIFGTG